MISHPAVPTNTTNQSRQCVCPVCSFPSVEKRAAGRDRLFHLAAGSFDLYRCLRCRCVFQDPPPENSALASFYPREYWWSGAESGTGWLKLFFLNLEKAYREFVTRGHARFVAECARARLRGERRLLDIGCGNGTFLKAARGQGFTPHGMDVSARAVEIARNLAGCQVKQGEIGSKLWEDSPFDLITMFHVLEHLPNPRMALNYAKELLRPGGMLILQVPNVASMQARLFGERWYGLDVPRHVINYTPEALAHLLREEGFDFRLSTRFSLRDNPASIASSLSLWMDPIHRKGMELDPNPVLGGVVEIAYLGLFLLSPEEE